MKFSRPEFWSGLPCLPSGDLPDPGIEPESPALQADSLPSESPAKPPAGAEAFPNTPQAWEVHLLPPEMKLLFLELRIWGPHPWAF